jgi:hypothetical protein
MIISYRYNYIFVKTKKTAGTTVELNLAPSCGPDDVITELGVQEELLRGNGVPLCRNFATPEVEESVRQGILARKGTKQKSLDLGPRRERNTFWNHMHAADIKSRVPEDVWNKAFKFTIERHPYEKAVSMAYFKFKPNNTREPFEKHLDDTVRLGRYAGFPFYTIHGKVAVDEIIRTESLLADLKRLGEKLGFPVPDKLLSAKTRSRADRRPAREILSAEQRKVVQKFCKKEFELLGWEP